MGVIFVYNDLILILLSVFAVFGIYAVIREIVMACTKSRGIVYAVRFSAGDDAMRTAEVLLKAEHLAGKCRDTERRPVLLTDSAGAREAGKFGYEVYVKQ